MSRVWCIRGGEGNRLVDAFVDGGYTAVGYYLIPDGRTVTESEVAAVLRSEKRTVPERRAAMFEDFVRHVAPGDVVVMPDTPRGEVVVGRVDGPYEYRGDLPAEQYRHRRKMRWVGRHRIDDLPTAWAHLYKQRPTLQVCDAPELVTHASRVEAGELGRPATHRRAKKASSHEATKAATGTGQGERRCPGPCDTMRPVAQFAGHGLCPDCR